MFRRCPRRAHEQPGASFPLYMCCMFCPKTNAPRLVFCLHRVAVCDQATTRHRVPRSRVADRVISLRPGSANFVEYVKWICGVPCPRTAATRSPRIRPSPPLPPRKRPRRRSPNGVGKKTAAGVRSTPFGPIRRTMRRRECFGAQKLNTSQDHNILDVSTVINAIGNAL